MNNSEKLRISQWILERNLQWIAAAEVKIGVVVALDTAMLGALATAFGALLPADRTALGIWSTSIAGGLLGAALVFAAMSLLPRTRGPAVSHIFFGKIAATYKDAADYQRAMNALTEAQLLDDCLAQIHRNSQIACAKFDWVKCAMWCSFAGLPVWLVALGSLIRHKVSP